MVFMFMGNVSNIFCIKDKDFVVFDVGGKFKGKDKGKSKNKEVIILNFELFLNLDDLFMDLCVFWDIFLVYM